MVTRLELYQRMADILEIKQIPILEQEFNDRFGVPPKEVENLLYILKIRVLAKDTGIESISNLDGEIIIQLFAGMQLNKQKTLSFLPGRDQARQQSAEDEFAAAGQRLENNAGRNTGGDEVKAADNQMSS